MSRSRYIPPFKSSKKWPRKLAQSKQRSRVRQWLTNIRVGKLDYDASAEPSESLRIKFFCDWYW